jgi:octaprenyl-diphosphate synthase
VKASEDDIQKLKLIGEKVGIAFQIKDDLLDFGDSETGKPKGGDIKERKLTLPLIYTLNQANAETRKKIIYIVKNQNTDTEKVAWIIDQIRESGGLKYAEQNMQQYIREALDLLDTFPDSPSRSAFKELIHFVITRRS